MKPKLVFTKSGNLHMYAAVAYEDKIYNISFQDFIYENKIHTTNGVILKFILKENFNLDKIKNHINSDFFKQKSYLDIQNSINYKIATNKIDAQKAENIQKVANFDSTYPEYKKFLVPYAHQVWIRTENTEGKLLDFILFLIKNTDIKIYDTFDIYCENDVQDIRNYFSLDGGNKSKYGNYLVDEYIYNTDDDMSGASRFILTKSDN